ncbi:MAG TPA: MBL fold metallo-hydrolase [Myxococcales bacterium]|jgi:L-ascorbate metabolism protein UlaG (beta-lactamase superfamily)
MPRSLDLPSSGPLEPWGAGSLLFVGTATTLLRFGGFTVLTDPNFLHRGEVAHFGWGLSARRLTDPAVELVSLPDADFVLLSHLHEDHFDRVVERELAKDVPIVTTPHAAEALARKAFTHTQPLETWESVSFSRGGHRLEVTSLPAQHGPRVVSRLLPPTMGSLLEFSDARGRQLRVYFSGDTLVHEALREIPRRFPDIDLAVLHLGGARVLGILVTLDARQGVEALRLVDPKLAVPVHFDDYPLFKSSIEEFRRAVSRAGLDDKVHYLLRGETLHFHARPGLAAVETVTLPAPLGPP